MHAACNGLMLSLTRLICNSMVFPIAFVRMNATSYAGRANNNVAAETLYI
jgi:hypothetical protein